jgi:acyl-CoA thioesterase FadM
VTEPDGAAAGADHGTGPAGAAGADDRASIVVPYRARFDECGPDGMLRASTLLRWAQDVAWIHSERLGFGREWYAERNLGWVVRGLELEIFAPIPMGTTADVTTTVTGMRRVMARRRTEVALPTGVLAAWADTDWVMTDALRAAPTRVPAEFPGLFNVPPGGFEPVHVRPLPMPSDLPVGRVAERRFAVRPQELDPMAHANNATYVDWLEEAVAAAAGPTALSRLPRRYRLEYLTAASPGADLVAVCWSADGRTWDHVLRAASASAERPGEAPLLNGQIVLG